MMNIYICEDDKRQLAFIKQTVDNIVTFYDTDINLARSSQYPDEILEYAKKTKNCGLYFLDVELGNDCLGGFHLAQKLREIEPRCFIVFITSHSDLSFYTYKYKLEAMDYIIKDDADSLREQIISCVNEAYSRHTGGALTHKTVFVVPHKTDREVTIPYRDIFLFKVNPENHKIAVHAKNRYIEFLGNLSDIQSHLDNRFFLCHRGCIINLNHVREFLSDSNEILMEDETPCPVSIRKRKEFFKLLEQRNTDNSNK